MSFAKVSAGQKLRIPAEAYNAFVDAAEAFKAQSRSQQVDRTGVPLAAGMALVRNDAGKDLDRFSVVGLDVPLITPTDNLLGFQEHLTFSGISPDADQHAQRFGISQEPIASGAIGRVLVIGVTPMRLDVQDEKDDLAAVVTDESGTLKTGMEGGARILWKEAGTGTKWGLVQLPAGAAGGGSANLVLKVSVTSHGWFVGDVLHWSGAAWALADTGVVGSSDTLGVVGRIPDNDTALVVLWGVLCLDGLDPHTDYWLDPSTPGALTATKPTTSPRLVLHHSENRLCVVRAGSAGGSGSAERFADLTDVDVTTTPPTDKQAPVWDATAERWKPHDVVLADPVPANHLLAGPKTGADAKPTFRAMVLEDLPELQPCSVVANATNTQLPPTALAALDDDRALVRMGGTLQWLQIATAILADGAVTSPKLGPGAVDTAAVADGAITDAKIISLTWAKLMGLPPTFPPSPHDHPLGGDLTGTTANAQIAANAVGMAELADGSVTAAKLAAITGPAVLGRPSGGTGAAGAIAAVTDGGVLRRSGGTLGFARITDLEVAAGAAIAWSKISTTGAVAADVGASPVNHTHSLASLGDVAITAPTVGQVLAYDAVNGRWINDHGASGPGTMRPLSVWANPTSANADGTDFPATIDNRVLVRYVGTLFWSQVNRAVLTDGAASSVIGRTAATSGPVADIPAGVNSVLRRLASGDLGFGKITVLQIDSEQPDGGAVLTSGVGGQPTWNRTVTLGNGAGSSASIQGALVVVISNTGDYAKISSGGIELFRRSVSTLTPLVKLDLNTYASWTLAKAMGIREVDVCENGVAKKMLVLASATF